MPSIADPYANRAQRSAPDAADPRSPAPQRPSLWVRAGTAVHRTALTGALAHGALPSQSPALTLRARQLTSERKRRSLARALRRAIAEAGKPPLARSRLSLIRSTAVLEAREAINTLIDRVNSFMPVRAEGMAMAELILNNAERSQLYNLAEPGTLRRQIKLATAAMDDAPESSAWHEFALAA